MGCCAAAEQHQSYASAACVAAPAQYAAVGTDSAAAGWLQC